MAVAQRRRKDREPLNQVVAMPGAGVPAPSGQEWVGTLAIEPSQQDIARRAYEIYQERGGVNGHDQDHWFQAERELRQVLHYLADKMVLGDS